MEYKRKRHLHFEDFRGSSDLQGQKEVEEFSDEIEDVGRDVNHSWDLKGLDVQFGKAHKSWKLSQGRSSPGQFADQSKKER